MIRSLLLWASRRPGLGRAAARNRLFRSGVGRFIPGEDRDDALKAAAALKRGGLSTVFTLLGEHVTSEAEVAATVEEYRAVLKGIGGQALDGHLSVKLTQLGLDLDGSLAEQAVEALVRDAMAMGSMIWIDMESSAYRERTLTLFSRLLERHGPDGIGVCVQAYLHSTPSDLDSLLPLRPRLRLVKGAYAEAPHLAFRRKADVDEAFFRLACSILQSGSHLAVGSHDPTLVTRVNDWIALHDIPPHRYEYQMLYGIGVPLREELVAAGQVVRVLISYGPGWFPWYMRRLAERPANLWFAAKAVLGG